MAEKFNGDLLGYLSKKPSPVEAFSSVLPALDVPDGVQKLYALTDEEIIQLVLPIYFAGLAFLVDTVPLQFLQELGTDAWTAHLTNMVGIFFTRDPVAVASELGHSAEYIQYMKDNPLEPFVLTQSKGHIVRGFNCVQECTSLLLPPTLALLAMDAPIEAMAKVVFTATQVRDALWGVRSKNPEASTIRPYAAVAHFLHWVLAEYPEVRFTHRSREIMKWFPHGLKSLRSGVWYHGTMSRPSSDSNPGYKTRQPI